MLVPQEPQDARFYFPVDYVSGTNGFVPFPCQSLGSDRAHMHLLAPNVMHPKCLSPGLRWGFIHQYRGRAVLGAVGAPASWFPPNPPVVLLRPILLDVTL